MTTLELTFLIVLAVFTQVAILAAAAFYRHWVDYQALRQRLAGAPADLPPPPVVGAPTAAAWEGWREFRVVRKVVEAEDRSIQSFHLAPVDARPLPLFRPGQFLTFRLHVDAPGGGAPRQVVRCYSLSAGPGPDHYRITVKRVPPPRDAPGAPPGLASNHLHERVGEGAILQVRAPSGHFHVSGEPGVPMVLVGGGIGITPLLSSIDTLLQRDEGREVWLFYGVRNGAEQVMKEYLYALAAANPRFHLHVCYSAPRAGEVEGVDYHHRGHVDIRLLRLSLPLKRHQFYVCGPQAMMESLVPALEQWGVAPVDIHYEAFGPASLTRHERAPAAGPGPLVTFRKSGKTIPWDPSAASLLEFAEANGIEVDSGCRAGGCGCCRTPVEAGAVRYCKEPDADVPQGHCLLCISAPETDLTLSA